MADYTLIEYDKQDHEVHNNFKPWQKVKSNPNDDKIDTLQAIDIKWVKY